MKANPSATATVGSTQQTRSSAKVLAALLLGIWALAAPLGANEMQEIFEMGKALFNQGKYSEAKPLLEQVAAANPRHAETQAMLARIRLLGQQGPSLQQRLATVRLEKVEFSDLTVPEALQGLKALAKQASGGKVVPNFIVKGEDQMTQRVSLSLKDIPLTDAIKYVADMSKTLLRYEANAVVISTP